MFICGTDRKWIDIPFFRSQFTIITDKEIKTLQAYCRTVAIDTERGVDVFIHEEAKTEIEQYDLDVPVEANSDKNYEYRKNYEQRQTILSEVLNDVRLGRSVDNPKVRGIVQAVITDIVKDSQAMIGLIHAKDKNETLARKSLNVCILALAFGKHIGLPKEKMYVLGVGALLHDIGMVQIPRRILLKKQPLTPAERTLMKKHTEYGLALLSKTPEIPVDALKIVYSHHECMDGKGYPQKLQGKKIGLLTRMVAIVSVYEALTRERFYSQTLSPVAALKYLYISRKTIFDAALVEKFIQALGIYPMGCIVELNTGELGIVIKVNQDDRLRPALRMVTNAQKQLLTEEWIIDLADNANKHIEIGKTLEMDNPIVELFIKLNEQANGQLDQGSDD